MAKQNHSNVPNNLRNISNAPVLEYLRGLSAHSDIAIPLIAAAREHNGAKIYCSDVDNFGHVFIYSNDCIFGFAAGMHGISLRTAPVLHGELIQLGAKKIESLGPDWLFFELFGKPYFEPKIGYLVSAAYSYA